MVWREQSWPGGGGVPFRIALLLMGAILAVSVCTGEGVLVHDEP